jgi:hypothetical protein
MEQSLKLPKRVVRIIDRCRSGETLCAYHHRKPDGGGETRYHFEPSGKVATPASAAEAIASGLLQPAGDGPVRVLDLADVAGRVMALSLSTWHSRLLEFRAVFHVGSRLDKAERDRLVGLVDGLLGDLADRQRERAAARTEQEAQR